MINFDFYTANIAVVVAPTCTCVICVFIVVIIAMIILVKYRKHRTSNNRQCLYSLLFRLITINLFSFTNR